MKRCVLPIQNSQILEAPPALYRDTHQEVSLACRLQAEPKTRVLSGQMWLEIEYDTLQQFLPLKQSQGKAAEPVTASA